MSSNKRYNQILFLMTLSVYMGLVLAGGASPALAQAAMAKGFELKTELEAKDDLDKKPKDEKASDADDPDISQVLSVGLPSFARITPNGYEGKFDAEKAFAKIGGKYSKVSRINFDLTGTGYEPGHLQVLFSTQSFHTAGIHIEPVFENDQSILITNLPRAGLGLLLTAGK